MCPLLTGPGPGGARTGSQQVVCTCSCETETVNRIVQVALRAVHSDQ